MAHRAAFSCLYNPYLCPATFKNGTTESQDSVYGLLKKGFQAHVNSSLAIFIVAVTTVAEWTQSREGAATILGLYPEQTEHLLTGKRKKKFT